METQWSLVIFTLFVCLSCGTAGFAALLSLQGKGEKIAMPAVITSVVALAVGGLGSFTHLQHWERIFNGFGHITSGITQELIGVVVMGVLLVVWFAMLKTGKGTPKALAIVVVVASIAMVCATAHSYMMPARPAWGIGLLAFYLANGILLGAASVWILGIVAHDEDVSSAGAQFSFIGSIVQLVADAVYVAAAAMCTFSNFGYYADPTTMTTAPTHITSLMDVMVAGPAAGMFWGSIVCALIVAALAFLGRKNAASAPVAGACALVALAGSTLFRVLIYIVGYSMVLLY